MIDFSSVFGHPFFCYPTYSAVTKSIWKICRSVIPGLKAYQKAQLVLNFLNVATFFLPKYKLQLFHLGLSVKLCKHARYFIEKLVVLCFESKS